ncbi:alpha/beta hydrolase [Sphingobium aromaticivastans]|uniref:alpha/beta hydrolase n=1 Tax=Sphingobium aromaticivastans TaxID=1778665 RepID=UPI003015A8EC
MPDAFDPDVETYLALVAKSQRPAFEALSVADARAFYRSGRGTVNLPPVAVGPIEDLDADGRMGPIRLRHYRTPATRQAPGPCILFFHGGGWVIGDLDTHDSICQHLVLETGLPLIAVDYRLAPEHPFPAAVEDSLDVHGWIIGNADSLDIDPARIIVAGDSAGGCLALVTALSAEDSDRPRPMAQLLFYPVTDIGGTTASYQEVRDVPLTASTMDWFVGHYLPDGADGRDWRMSPARSERLSTAPPTFITVAGHDPLRDEGLALAAMLEAEGVTVQLRYLPGQVHGYLTLGRLIGEAGQTLSCAARFIKNML